MKIEKQHNGSLLITDIINNQYIKQVYFGYTKKDAIADFKIKILNAAYIN